MIRFTAILCLCLSQAFVLAPASAEPGDPFLAERLTPADTRLLQAALALSGHYNGLIDGVWGRHSSQALIAATGPRPTEGEALSVLLPLLDDEGSGWLAINNESASMLVPSALLIREDDPEDPFMSYATPMRDLILRVMLGTMNEASDMHGWLTSNTLSAFYRADTSTAFITKGQLQGGDTVYLWTRSLNGTYVTVLVQWNSGQASRARLMIASLSTRYVPDLHLPPNGYVARMVADLDAKLASKDPYSDAPSSPAPGRTQTGTPDIVGTGTGFLVSPTAIVTAAHVVEGCGSLRLADGSAVAIGDADRSLDLAVLLRPDRADGGKGDAAPVWLELARSAARLGSPVTAVGYPYSGLFAQGVTATGGNISALRGLDGSVDQLSLSAPVQPGNSGGPLLDRSGRVLGVVIARANEVYVRERSGTAPENMNVATQLNPLRTFLDRAGVVLPASMTEETRERFPGDGLPDEVIRAVVQIHCLN